jgi:protein phosphatase
VFIDRAHDWHLELCDQLVEADPQWFTKTRRLVVDVTDADSQAAGIAWWEKLTAAGGEGMVVKPSLFTVRGRKGLVQPGIKCRAASTCGSSTAPNTQIRANWNGSAAEA